MLMAIYSNIIIWGLITLSIVLAVKSIISLKYLIKNRKCFKYALMLAAPVTVKDVIQFLAIFLLFIFNIFFIYFITFGYRSLMPCYDPDVRFPIKKALSALNQAVILEQELEKKQIKDFFSANDFAVLMVRRLNVVDIRNIKAEGIVYKVFSPIEIKTQNLSEYKDKPYFVTADGIEYIITKYETGCKNVDLENLVNSSCLVLIDVNGKKKPNTQKFNKKKPNQTDRFTFIIDGEGQKIVIPNSYHDIVYDSKVK